ncbi:MAG: hypothetical protein ACYSYW_12925, partial [Planctomycetota bacterium]
WEPYRYGFVKEIEAINSRYEEDKEDNAATIYNLIFEDNTTRDLVPFKIKPNTYKFTQQNIWKSDEYPELFNWLKVKEELISRYIEGAFKKKCYFPIQRGDIDVFPARTMRNHLEGLQLLSSMVMSSACNDLGEGRIEEGLLKQKAVLCVSEQLKSQLIDNDILIGFSLQGLVLNSIQLYVINHEPDESYLEPIEAELAGIGHDWADTWERIATFEQFDKTNYIHWYLYEVNPKGKVRFKVQNYLFLGNFISAEDLPYWPRRIAKAQNIIVWFFLPGNPDKIKDIVTESMQDYSLLEEFVLDRKSMKRAPLFAREELNLGCFVNMYMNSSVYYIYEYFMNLKIELSASRIIIGLRRYKNKHGYWPRHLDETSVFVGEDVLVDPSNGGEYAYKVKDDGFVLYSKGMDKIDNEGFNYRRDPGRVNSDDWWIWPPRR